MRSLFIFVLCFVFNDSFSQYIYMREINKYGEHLPSLIIAKSKNDITSIIDTNETSRLSVIRRFVIVDEHDYNMLSDYLKKYKVPDSLIESQKPVFLVSESKCENNFGFKLIGKDSIIDFLFSFNKFIELVIFDANFLFEFDNYCNRVLERCK